ncbi:hypothetical protein HYQ44_004595 [Verticillium longisporum]|nr:hypothetical protein HYQ44_004595 [Verticillium longisporum]
MRLFGSLELPLPWSTYVVPCLHSCPVALLSVAVNATESRSFLRSSLHVLEMVQALFPNHRRDLPPTMATWAAIARKAAETTAEALE